MTLDEARTVAAIVQWADGGCPVCVSQLVDDLNEAFPQFSWRVHDDDDFPSKVIVDGK